MNAEALPPSERDERFRRAVTPHIPALLAAARGRTAQLADAEDLVQDTLVRAFRGLHRFDGAHPRAWLMTILRSAGANDHRRWRPALLDDPDRELDRVGGTIPQHSAEHIALNTEFDDAVKDALRSLTQRQRTVIAIVDIEGLSYAQAAQRLDVPEGTIMSRLHAARARMRRHLGDAGVVPKRGDTR